MDNIEDRLSMLCLHLGYVTGAMSDEALREEVVASIRGGGLNIGYIVALRDYCDGVIKKSGADAP